MFLIQPGRVARFAVMFVYKGVGVSGFEDDVYADWAQSERVFSCWHCSEDIIGKDCWCFVVSGYSFAMGMEGQKEQGVSEFVSGLPDTVE